MDRRLSRIPAGIASILTVCLALGACGDSVMETQDLGDLSAVWRLSTTIASNTCGLADGQPQTDQQLPRRSVLSGRIKCLGPERQPFQEVVVNQHQHSGRGNDRHYFQHPIPYESIFLDAQHRKKKNKRPNQDDGEFQQWPR